MNHVLITGMSGVGKTTAIGELRLRGITCIDMDESGWSYLGPDGHQHWNVKLLEGAMAEEVNKDLFVSGCAEEQAALYHRFGVIILLSAPKEIMIERIHSRSGKSFGQNPVELAQVLEDLENIEPLLRRRCSHEIKTIVPVKEVVDQILQLTYPTRQ